MARRSAKSSRIPPQPSAADLPDIFVEAKPLKIPELIMAFEKQNAYYNRPKSARSTIQAIKMESNWPSAQKPDRDRPTLLALKGELDLHVFPQITASLDALIEKRPRHLVVDVSGVTYIDSAGLAALIVAMQKVEAYGGQLSLAGFQTTVRSIFRMSRLDRVFHIFPDVDAALTHQASNNLTRTREKLSFAVRSTV